MAAPSLPFLIFFLAQKIGWNFSEIFSSEKATKMENQNPCIDAILNNLLQLQITKTILKEEKKLLRLDLKRD